MSETMTAVIYSDDQAREIFIAAMSHAKALRMNGERVAISVGPVIDDISAKQRRFFHGPVLTQISEQVRVLGERFVVAVWKEYYRKLFLPDTWEMRKMPGAKRATPHRVRRSTEDLGVKGYSEYIDRVTAHAATEFGVEFDFDPSERHGVRYVAPRRSTNPKDHP